MRWAVIAIDWSKDNVLAWWDSEEKANESAEGFDGLSLRSIAVPEGHPMIRSNMYFYLAGSFNRKAELQIYAEALTVMGHHVTSRWLFDESFDVRGSGTDDVPMDLGSDEVRRIAIADLEDIDQAGAMILFSGVGQVRRGRGGRHTEFGYALKDIMNAADTELILIGERENAFMSLIPDGMIWEDFEAFVHSDYFTRLSEAAQTERFKAT